MNNTPPRGARVLPLHEQLSVAQVLLPFYLTAGRARKALFLSKISDRSA
jgi:hypothetical protein